MECFSDLAAARYNPAISICYQRLCAEGKAKKACKTTRGILEASQKHREAF